MSKGTIVIRGSGGGSAFAIIQAIYPVGSICTCTNGTRTLTAKNTNGQWIFKIPKPAVLPETWAVKATDGTNEKIINVEITEEHQAKSVNLAYRTYLFEEGVGVIGTWYKGSNSGGSVNITRTDYISFANGNNTMACTQTDLTNYDTLYVEAELTANHSSSAWRFVFGADTDKPSEDGNGSNLYSQFSTRKSVSGTFARQVLSLSIADLEGLHYVGYAGICSGKIYNVYME